MKGKSGMEGGCAVWLLFGVSAVITAALNLACCLRGREAKWARFSSLSLTALTVCAFYSAGATWVLQEDWAGLADVMPTMSKLLWGCVLVSILVNGISLFYRRKH